jgi:hypothetical protein
MIVTGHGFGESGRSRTRFRDEAEQCSGLVLNTIQVDGPQRAGYPNKKRLWDRAPFAAQNWHHLTVGFPYHGFAGGRPPELRARF